MDKLQRFDPATPGQVAVQKILTLAAKACLSSIPFAALSLDFGQVLVDFANDRAKAHVSLANQKLTEQFLRELAARIEILEIPRLADLSRDANHQIAAHSALRTLVSETNERVAFVLARAVGLLAEMPQGAAYKAQCARVISEMTEPMLHALQTNDRFHRGLLSEEERFYFDGLDEKTQQMAALLDKTMPLPDWEPVMRRIMDIGLIEQIIDMGTLGNANPMVQTAPSSDYGRLIISLCFEDGSIPQFGRYAAS